MRFNALEHHRTIAYSTLTPSIACRDAVKEGAIQSNQLELHANDSELVCILCYLRNKLVQERSMRSNLSELVYISAYLCDDVVREGSMRFAVLKPPRTSA